MILQETGSRGRFPVISLPMKAATNQESMSTRRETLRLRLNRSGSGLVITTFACLVMMGCGGGAGPAGPATNATVTGKVTKGGQPVTNATISFEKPGFGAWGGPVGADGTYTVTIAAGDYGVSVTPAASGPASMSNDGKTPKDSGGQTIPQKYWLATSSGVTTTVNEGDNTFDLELTD